MATTVSIQVRIDDANVNETLGRIEQSLTQVGTQGSTSLKKTSVALDEMKGHAATNLDAVRLLSQEFGFRLPRALESMLSRIPAVTGALNGMLGVMAGIAGAEVFVRLGKDIYDAEQKFISITAVADKFYEALKKASEVDFTNTHSIETSRMREQIAYTNSQQQIAAANTNSNSGWTNVLVGGSTLNPLQIGRGLYQLGTGHAEAEQGYKSKQQSLDLQGKDPEDYHQEQLRIIDLNHALDENLSKRQQIVATEQKDQQVNAENRRYNNEQDRRLGNPVATDAGSQEQKDKDAIAAKTAAAKDQQLTAEDHLEIIKAQSEAREAGLRGEALYAQKLQDELTTLHAELIVQRDSTTETARAAALQARYDGEKRERQQKLDEETRRMHDTASLAGMTGSQRIAAEGVISQRDIDQSESEHTGGGVPSPGMAKDYNQQRIEAASATNQKLDELNNQFLERAKEVALQRSDVEQGAFGRIDASAARSTAELKKSYDEDVKGLEDGDQRKVAATEAYKAAVAAIDADADRQKAEQRARNQAEDLQYDREAAQAEAKVRGDGLLQWGSQYRNTVAEIQLQEQERIVKITEDAQREGLTWEEMERRRVDATMTANAQIQEAQQQQAHELAGTLEQLWDNPLKTMEDKAKKAMFEVIANWMMQTKLFQSFFGAQVGSLQPGAGGVATNAGTAAGIPAAIQQLLGGGSGATAPAGYTRASSTVASPAAMMLGDSSSAPSGYTSASSTASSPDVRMLGPSSMTVNSRTPSDLSQGVDLAGGALSLTHQLGLTGSRKPAASYSTNASFGDDGGAGGGGSDDDSTGGAGGGDTPSAFAGTAMGYAGAGLAGYQGAEGVLSSFHEEGAKGVLDGAMSGAALGATIGSIVPGLGTVVGGAIGAAAGTITATVGDIMGEGNKFGARDYYKKSVEPQLEALRTGSTSSGESYLAGVSEANKDSHDAMTQMTTKFGSEAANWVNSNYMAKELTEVVAAIERGARGNANYGTRQASEYHMGGLISNFGDLGTSTNEGYIHALLGEGVVNQPAMAMHGAGVGLMNKGADAATMAAHYLQASDRRGGVGGGDTHYHTHNYSAIDAKSFGKFLDSGGMSEINKSANKRTSLYAGEGIG
jgi:hypothetical protein